MTATPQPTQAQSLLCQVTYDNVNDWGSGASINMSIINNGTTAIDGWTLDWTFPGNQQITNLWNANYTQTGADVSASNLSYNNSISANGGSVDIGFNMSYSGTNDAPASFAVNGVTCGGAQPTATNTTVPPTATDTVPPTATNTTVPPTATDTVPPTATNTTVPPTATNTTAPPTATDTVPPTATNTTVPPTATDTVPPTATSTSVVPTNTPPPPSGGLKVQYRVGEANASTNQVKPIVNIVNTGSSSVALTDLTVRYWYTIDGQNSQEYHCDYAVMGCANVTGSFHQVANPQAGADYYLEIGFSSGSLAAGAQTDEIQNRFNKAGWSNYDQTNDHSFDATKTAFEDWVNVTLYQNGQRVWGYEPGPLPTPSPTPGPTTPAAVFRVNSEGSITKDGQVFPVQCGSWFGLEGRHEPSTDPINPGGAALELYVGNTTWANGGAGTGRTIQQTMAEITAMGINVVRFPIAPQTLDATDPQGMAPNLKNHPSVLVPTARQAMEEFIVLADQNNIEVMLDMHSCSNYLGWRAGRLDARPPYVDFDRDMYDYYREDSSCAATNNPAGVTRIQAYDEAQWLDDLRTMAGLGDQLGVDNIIGIDIFNEPWDYTWEEWKTLSEHAYTAINDVNPNTLLFVQGISASAGNQDGSPETIIQVPHGDEATNPNWGENLFEAGPNPPNIPKERLVYSPHTYGPSVFVQEGFMDPAQPQCAGLEGDAAGDADCNIVINVTQLRQGWEEHFGYLKDQGYAIVVGEYGGNLDWPGGAASLRDQARWDHITPGVDQVWQDAFTDYMVEKDIEGCYWSINPESGDTGGWYGHTYDPVSNPTGWGEWLDFDQRKTVLLSRLWGPQ